jgi:hypothetical protein
MSTQNKCVPSIPNSPYMTIIWLICQLICFPIVLAILALHAIHAFARSHWNGALSILTVALTFLQYQCPSLLLWLSIPSSYLLIAAITLPTCYIMGNLLNRYRITTLLLLTAVISIHFYLVSTTWLGPITLQSAVLLLNALWWSTLTGIAIAQNLYSAYYPQLTAAEQQCINQHLMSMMVTEGHSTEKTASSMTFHDYWHAFAIFSVQSKYEALLQQAEQAYVKQIQTQEDPTEKQFLLCKLIHVMCSDTLTLKAGETLTKHSLIPAYLRSIAGDFYFYSLETEAEHIIVFSGTSFLPNPCPSAIWSIIGNMTPGCSVGYPLLWLGKNTIQQHLLSKKRPHQSIRFTGFSMGGSFAKLANIELTLDEYPINTFNAPGLLTWHNRACYTLVLALLSAMITALHTYITTMHWWPPLLGFSSLIALSVVATLSISSIFCFSLFLSGKDDKIFSMKNVTSFINTADCIAHVATQPQENINALCHWWGNLLSTHIGSPIKKKAGYASSFPTNASKSA